MEKASDSTRATLPRNSKRKALADLSLDSANLNNRGADDTEEEDFDKPALKKKSKQVKKEKAVKGKSERTASENALSTQ